MKKLLVIAAVAVSHFTFSAAPANAESNFNYTPESFHAMLQSSDWGTVGETVNFSHLAKCQKSDSVDYPSYYCHSGFVTISSPLGTKVCKLQTAVHNTEKVFYLTKACNWK